MKYQSKNTEEKKVIPENEEDRAILLALVRNAVRCNGWRTRGPAYNRATNREVEMSSPKIHKEITADLRLWATDRPREFFGLPSSDFLTSVVTFDVIVDANNIVSVFIRHKSGEKILAHDVDVTEGMSLSAHLRDDWPE